MALYRQVSGRSVGSNCVHLVSGRGVRSQAEGPTYCETREEAACLEGRDD